MSKDQDPQSNHGQESTEIVKTTDFDKMRQELLEFSRQPAAGHRPILTHLNADTTWLLSLPYPEYSNAPTGRSRFNILVDPWLKGSQSDVASWFSTQWHAVKSSVQTIAELETILAETDASLQVSGNAETNPNMSGRTSFIDMVAISHEFTDHCHKATLLEISPNVPVFATTKAAELIRSWKHFETVVEIEPFSSGGDWRTTSIPLLPDWLGIGRLVTASDSLYYHSAVMIFVEHDQTDHAAEVVIYTPHGVESATFTTLASAKPSVRTLALLHGLHDVSLFLSKQLNLGALNALKVQKELQAKYWVGTHDEVKIGGGFIAPFLRRKAYTILDTLTLGQSSGRRETSMSDNNDGAAAGGIEEGAYLDLHSGQSLILA